MAAEIERDLISQRTKNGLARVKAEGKKLGNRNLKADNRRRIEKANTFAQTLRVNSPVLSKTATHNVRLSMSLTESESGHQEGTNFSLPHFKEL